MCLAPEPKDFWAARSVVLSRWRNFALGAIIQTEQMSPRLGQDTGVNRRKHARLARQAVGEQQRYTQAGSTCLQHHGVGVPTEPLCPACPSGFLAEERRGREPAFHYLTISAELPSSLVDKRLLCLFCR